MNIEIISIGDELLDGSVQEKNANFLSKEFKRFNITPHHISIVGDNKKNIKDLLIKAKNRSDIIIITGGLGPTRDDITRDAVAEAFDLKLVFNKEIKKEIDKRLKEYHVQVTDNNNHQAMIPENAEIIDNPNGTAPGFIINQNDTTCISMPGVPSEMKSMFLNDVLPYLDLNSQMKYQNKLFFKGLGEAQLEDKIFNSVNIPDDIYLSFVVKGDYILVKINGDDKNLVDKYTEEIKEKLNLNIFDDLNIVNSIYNIMTKNNLTLSTAESCTGGLLGNRITNQPGSSSYYKGGVVTYSNELKTKLLNIKPDLINKHGAVSLKIAQLMATNIKNNTNSDYGIAISGIAGPTGGSKEKPVGLVYVSVSGKNRTIIKRLYLKGKRKQIKYLSTEFSLKLLKNLLETEGYNEKV
ncbi:MAG: competence/damage-inducible protein A [Halanaerobiales bacterium]|nr:competence/damage-inducible protein A [Halanaerobiales bacterium]